MAFIRFLIAAMLFVVVAGGTAYAWRADQEPKQKHKHHHQKKISVQLGRFKLPPIAPLFDPGEHELAVGSLFYVPVYNNGGLGLFWDAEFDKASLAQEVSFCLDDPFKREDLKGGGTTTSWIGYRVLTPGVHTLKIIHTQYAGGKHSEETVYTLNAH